MTTGTPSRESLTSNSIPSAPSSSARVNAATVFSGASADAPRWPIIKGSQFMPNWKGLIGPGLCRRLNSLRCGIANHLLQRYIKDSILTLDSGADRQMALVVGKPDVDLTCDVEHSFWTKQLRVDPHCIDPSQHGFQSLLFYNSHGNPIHSTRVADGEAEAASH